MGLIFRKRIRVGPLVFNLSRRSDRERLLALLADLGIEPDELPHTLPAPGPNDVILSATDASEALAQFYFDDAGKFLRLQVRES